MFKVNDKDTRTTPKVNNKDTKTTPRHRYLNLQLKAADVLRVALQALQGCSDKVL